MRFWLMVLLALVGGSCAFGAQSSPTLPPATPYTPNNVEDDAELDGDEGDEDEFNNETEDESMEDDDIYSDEDAIDEEVDES